MLSTLIIVLICLLVEGFFSGSEIALISANKIKIKHKAEKGFMPARLIQDMFKTPEKLLGTTLVGTNLATVIGSVAMTAFMVSHFESQGALYTILIMYPLILMLGEIIPKTMYQRNADTICHIVIIPIKAFSYVFFPIIFIIQNAANLFAGIFKKADNGKNPFLKKDELKLIVETDKVSLDMKSTEREMISKIFNFGDITVKEVMTPLVELAAMEVNSSIDEVLNKAEKEGHSRIPIFDSRIYNIIGVANTFELFFSSDNKNSGLLDIMRPVCYVPESKRVDDLLKELQQSGKHIAIVVNEYGGSIGLVTLEDILEEIVGEIEDEYDDEERLYHKIGPNKYMVDARMEIDTIIEELHLNVPKGDYETLAGLILYKIERIPENGTVINCNTLTFTIEEADEKSIKKVCIDRM